MKIPLQYASLYSLLLLQLTKFDNNPAVIVIATDVPTEIVTNLNHVLDPTVGVLLNDRLNPDQGLHLRYENTYFNYRYI